MVDEKFFFGEDGIDTYSCKALKTQVIRPTSNDDGVWHIHIEHFGEIGEGYGFQDPERAACHAVQHLRRAIKDLAPAFAT